MTNTLFCENCTVDICDPVMDARELDGQVLCENCYDSKLRVMAKEDEKGAFARKLFYEWSDFVKNNTKLLLDIMLGGEGFEYFLDLFIADYAEEFGEWMEENRHVEAI